MHEARVHLLVAAHRAAHLGLLFPGMEVVDVEAFRVTRNADLDLDEEEAEDLLTAVELELRRRRFNQAVRLEVGPTMVWRTGNIRQPGATARVRSVGVDAQSALRTARPSTGSASTISAARSLRRRSAPTTTDGSIQRITPSDVASCATVQAPARPSADSPAIATTKAIGASRSRLRVRTIEIGTPAWPASPCRD